MNKPRAILDIPDASLLATYNIEDLVQIFCVTTGIETPDVICLPLYDQGGAQFDSRATSRDTSLWPRYNLEREIPKIRNKYPAAKIYFTIIPTLPGVRSSHLTCRSQYGEETAGACFVNPYVQAIIIDIVAASSEKFSPDGIIFDIVDIHGQSSKKGKFINVSCFCTYCRDALLDLKFDPAVFVQRNSPLNLVLSATETGVRFITPKAHYAPDQIVDLAINEGFIPHDNDLVRSSAETILDYVRVRSKVTGAALGEICRSISSQFSRITTGVVIGNPHFDWTSGTDLNGLAGQVKEVWLDLEDLTEQNVPPNTEIFAYVTDRARYHVDALFEVVSDRRYVETVVLKGEGEGLLQRIQSRLTTLYAAQNCNRTVIDSFGKMDYIAGFVGVPSDKKIYQRVVQVLRDEINSIMSDVPQESSTVTKDIVRKYIATLVKFAEDGNELTRREIVGLAAQLNLID